MSRGECLAAEDEERAVLRAQPVESRGERHGDEIERHRLAPPAEMRIAAEDEETFGNRLCVADDRSDERRRAHEGVGTKRNGGAAGAPFDLAWTPEARSRLPFRPERMIAREIPLHDALADRERIFRRERRDRFC